MQHSTDWCHVGNETDGFALLIIVLRKRESLGFALITTQSIPVRKGVKTMLDPADN